MASLKVIILQPFPPFFFLNGHCGASYRTAGCHICEMSARKDTFVEFLSWGSPLVVPRREIWFYESWKAFSSTMLVLWGEEKKEKKRKAHLHQAPQLNGSFWLTGV